MKEHRRNIQPDHWVKSAVVKHSITLGHRIQLHNISFLSDKYRHMDRITREATEIELHPINMIREDGFYLSSSL
jgi:hypothetical protein